MYRKQRKILALIKLSFLPEEQLKRMLADIGLTYSNNDSCDILAETLQNVYFIYCNIIINRV